jgi:iron(III) transport system ATP-binding protein
MPAELILDRVTKRYGDHLAVRQVNLHVQAGEFFTFLGPSGCGKTTLLRMIAGFVRPDEGGVYLDGQLMNPVPPWRRGVGMVFQNYALWPHMSVFDNVAFGLRERRMPRKDIARRVAEALKRVDLSGAEKRRPSQLSGGQQQRVALARTLVIEPGVLLLDEPLSNLDAKLRAEMRLELLKLQRDLGLTTIYVTHDQEEALAVSTRIAVMRGGQVLQEGKPREIYEQPKDQFVASFVGQANLFSGRVAECNEYLKIDAGGVMIRARVSGAATERKIGETVSLTIRPEAIELHKSGTNDGRLNHIDGQVVASAYRGLLIEYEIQTAGGVLKASVINPKDKPVFQQGERVSVQFAPEDMVLVGGN